MKWLLFIFITLVAAVAFAVFARDDHGYVLITVGGWTIEGTVTLLVAAQLILIGLSYAVIRLLVRVMEIPARVRHWRAERRHTIANRFLTSGLLALAEGRWSTAERLLLKHVAECRTPELNYLAAARAAQAQDSLERRDQYLRLAHEHRPQAEIAVGLTQAELQAVYGQAEQALATLQHLQQREPKHVEVLKALARVYTDLRQWEALTQLMRSLRKYRVFPPGRLDELEKSAYVHLLGDRGQDARQLQRIWNGVPRHFKYDRDIVLAYVQPLFASGESDLAESLIRTALSKQWDSELARQYGLLEGAHTLSQLAYAESWLLKYRDDPALLLTLGRLCMRERLWGKSRDYLEASLAIKPSLDAYHVLAALLDQLGDEERAMRYYRAGLQLATGQNIPAQKPLPGLVKKERRETMGPPRQPLGRPFNRQV